MTRSLSLAAALVLSASAPSSSARSDAPGAPPVKVRAVRAAAPSGGTLVPANVLALQRATLSTRLAASVRAVHVREGQRVAAGQLLVSLEDSDVRGGLAAAETGYAAAAAHERRVRALAAERAATPAELEMAGAQRAQAEAAVAAARANLSYAAIRAPFAGTVQARRIEPGDLVGPGQPLVELEGDGLELQASLSEEEARGLAVGARVAFRAGVARGQAVITALTAGGDALSHRRGLRARIGEVQGELRSGAFARLELAGPRGTAGTPWVPRSALVERGDLTGVFVASGGRAELRWIALGEATGDAVAVRAGLDAAETVVDAPGALRDGQAVEVLP
ncbi:MAG TPA: efflux RND transporter periplasmic adaptor subunit [Anaeromyxobacter sp.]|nr:efflux RND transporter periplasmic adaptor subunit [Anaeromyxobacter sp.]